MKFIHIADVHLGAQPEAGTAYSRQRPRELWDTFARVISLCEQEQTDLLLIAGDLFHRQPLMKELKEVNYLFSRLSHTQVVLIAGNHDYIRRDSFYRNFVWAENVHPLFGEDPEMVLLPEFQTAVYGFSYYSREIREARYDAVRAERAARYEILLAHGGDETHIPIQREALRHSGFDYVALGHIHKSGNLVEKKAAYAGSLEPTDRNDTGRHGFVRGELSEEGTQYRFVPFASREYIHQVVKVTPDMTGWGLKEKLQDIMTEFGRQNIYKFILQGFRDEELRFEPEHLDSFGNIIEIVDETRPAYDFDKLLELNRDNLLGRYIEAFDGCEEGSVEYQALYEGVQALLGN